MASLDNPFFYNSVNGDRVYDADSFEYLLKKFFTTGVFTGDCAVSATSGMGVQMAAGYCNIDGKVKFYPNPVSLSLATANPTYDRIDTVVIERNDTDRAFHVKAVTGSASATPAATAPVRSAGIYQIVLAEVYVAAGAVSITQANITDKRPDSSVCGLVCSAAQTPDFSDLYSQFTDAFGVWFDRMKGQLSTDAAGNLQNEIDDLAIRKAVTNSFELNQTYIVPLSSSSFEVYKTGRVVFGAIKFAPVSEIAAGNGSVIGIEAKDTSLVPFSIMLNVPSIFCDIRTESNSSQKVTPAIFNNKEVAFNIKWSAKVFSGEKVVITFMYMI